MPVTPGEGDNYLKPVALSSSSTRSRSRAASCASRRVPRATRSSRPCTPRAAGPDAPRRWLVEHAVVVPRDRLGRRQVGAAATSTLVVRIVPFDRPRNPCADLRRDSQQQPRRRQPRAGSAGPAAPLVRAGVGGPVAPQGGSARALVPAAAATRAGRPRRLRGSALTARGQAAGSRPQRAHLTRPRRTRRVMGIEHPAEAADDDGAARPPPAQARRSSSASRPRARGARALAGWAASRGKLGVGGAALSRSRVTHEAPRPPR